MYTADACANVQTNVHTNSVYMSAYKYFQTHIYLAHSIDTEEGFLRAIPDMVHCARRRRPCWFETGASL